MPIDQINQYYPLGQRNLLFDDTSLLHHHPQSDPSFVVDFQSRFTAICFLFNVKNADETSARKKFEIFVNMNKFLHFKDINAYYNKKYYFDNIFC